MRLTSCFGFLLTIHTIVFAQNPKPTTINWYSEATANGITIQNSFPKGGPYAGPTDRYYKYSRLVFFTRLVNETATPLDFAINFSADSIAIPGSPNVFMKLFLPPDTMTMDKQPLLNYGVTELKSLDHSTSFRRIVKPKAECLFYVVAIFYQTKPDAWVQERGGNRAELVLRGQDLFYKMIPQIDALPCGRLIARK